MFYWDQCRLTEPARACRRVSGWQRRLFSDSVIKCCLPPVGCKWRMYQVLSEGFPSWAVFPPFLAIVCFSAPRMRRNYPRKESALGSVGLMLGRIFLNVFAIPFLLFLAVPSCVDDPWLLWCSGVGRHGLTRYVLPPPAPVRPGKR